MRVGLLMSRKSKAQKRQRIKQRDQKKRAARLTELTKKRNKYQAKRRRERMEMQAREQVVRSFVIPRPDALLQSTDGVVSPPGICVLNNQSPAKSDVVTTEFDRSAWNFLNGPNSKQQQTP